MRTLDSPPGNLGSSILEPWPCGFLILRVFSLKLTSALRASPGGGGWSLLPGAGPGGASLPSPGTCPRGSLRPVVVTEERRVGGGVWLVGGYMALLTSSSCNCVVTAPEPFLCQELPQVTAAHLTRQGRESRATGRADLVPEQPRGTGGRRGPE